MPVDALGKEALGKEVGEFMPDEALEKRLGQMKYLLKKRLGNLCQMRFWKKKLGNLCRMRPCEKRLGNLCQLRPCEKRLRKLCWMRAHSGKRGWEIYAR